VALFRLRRRADHLTAPCASAARATTRSRRRSTANNRLEIAWTIVPFGILFTLFIVTAVNMNFITHAPDGSLKVCVLGQRFSWSYFYNTDCGAAVQVPGGENHDTKLSYRNILGRKAVSTLMVPAGRPVALEVVSADGQPLLLPSPPWAGRSTPSPNQLNHMWFQADKVGKYYGQCTELCGDNHYAMEIVVEAVPGDQFKAFIEPDGQQQRQGRHRRRRSVMAVMDAPLPRAPGVVALGQEQGADLVADHGRPQEAGHPLPVHHLLLLPDRRDHGAAGAHPARRAQNKFLTPPQYNQIFTMARDHDDLPLDHSRVRRFGNYLVPLMIGARDMAFPRITRALLLADPAGRHDHVRGLPLRWHR